jgi:hypothetical protein
MEEALEFFGSVVPPKVVYTRIRRGWDHIKALSTPYTNSKHNQKKKG